MKSFDCVRMKERIQAALVREHAGLTDSERMAALERKLKKSRTPSAKLWKRLSMCPAQRTGPGLRVAESGTAYGRKDTQKG